MDKQEKVKKGLGKLEHYQKPTEVAGMRLIKILLSSGRQRILATNLLNREVLDVQSIKELYNKRWGVEEAYKLFKKSIYIEYFIVNQGCIAGVLC